ncbi:MAPEG family protein [Futiania mangrovi]|uniref:MAPEG family protein n=1 Tax=Futiania mangrovi TaxID=2959716 RepID=A0A9J6PBD9_9PROT|nr:MAPEG family protein [Futiania mangrovii]MCP1337452.1 MAPEG family protein [Futiania mangrovii]
MITGLYAGALALLHLVLTFRVINARERFGVALGDGGQGPLVRRIRVQQNFAEHVPFAVLLIGLAELQGAPWWMVHAAGAALLLGRIAHAWGMSQDPEPMRFRLVGMTTTITILALAAAANVVLYAMGLAG